MLKICKVRTVSLLYFELYAFPDTANIFNAILAIVSCAISTVSHYFLKDL